MSYLLDELISSCFAGLSMMTFYLVWQLLQDSGRWCSLVFSLLQMAERMLMPSGKAGKALFLFFGDEPLPVLFIVKP
jgi:hypothetical protein